MYKGSNRVSNSNGGTVLGSWYRYILLELVYMNRGYNISTRILVVNRDQCIVPLSVYMEYTTL
jgi:hypothetical protein